MVRHKMGIRRGYGNAETSTESNVGIPSSLKREKFYPLLVLFILLSITFFPLIVGKNFVPFGKYLQWSFMLAQSSGQKLKDESSVFMRAKVMPWSEDPEVASLAIYWAESLYFTHKLKRGQFPLWDPYTGGGVPTIDNGQSRPFNPFRLPFYLCPTTWVYSLTLLVGLSFGGIGAYLWLLKQGFSLSAVTLGVGLFIFNPWVLERLVLTDSAAYFVLPWCLLTLEQTLWRNWSSIARAALCFILMGHSGHPEASIIMAAVATTVFLFNQKGLGNCERSFVNRIKTVGTVAMLTFVCLTVIWLPFLRLLTMGDIYRKHLWFICEYSWRSLITLPSDMFIAPAIGAMLLCALLTWKRIPKVWMALLIIVVLILFPLPWIGTMPSRLLSHLLLPSFYLKSVFWTSLSFLVPYGLDAYRTSKKSIAIIVFIIGGAMLTLTGWQFASIQMARSDISVFPIITFLLLSLGVLALVFFRSARTRLFPLLMSAIILAPLAFPLSLNKLSWNTIDFKTNSVIEWLKLNRPNARTVSIEPRFLFAIPPNFGQAYGIRCVEINSAIFLNNYWSLFHHPETFMPTAIIFNSYFPDVFRYMGADILLLANNVSLSGLDLLIKGTQFSAYSIPGAHGRLYFAERARQYKPGTDCGKQILSLNRDTDAVAVVEGMGNPVPAVIPEVPPGKGKAVFETDEAEDILARTGCSLEGLLVLRDSWYPGWQAFIDGKRTPTFRVNGCFRGVIVPAGEHRVRFVYRPILLYVAGVVSLAATLLITVVCLQKHLTKATRRFYKE
jgi:hypothetical protein